MKPKLTDADYCRAARNLNVEVAAIKAVAEVESLRAGFDAQGRPTILFERHKFYKYARERKKWFAQYPHICNPTAGGYGKTGEQYGKFELAYSLDPFAAMMACSWGAFQEMGFNYDDLGFDSVGTFVAKMKESEAAQLEIFIRSVRAKGLVDELQRRDWTHFAFGYNGAGYKKNNYDRKMADKYKIHAARPVNCPEFFANLRDDEIHLEIDRPGVSEPTVSLPVKEAESSASLPEQSAPAPDLLQNPSTETAPGENKTTSTFSLDTPEASIRAETTEPAGDAPEAAPRWHLSIEDLKPFVQKWLARIWKGNGSLNFAQLPALTGIGLKFGGEYWWIWVVAGVLLMLATTAIAVIISIILGVILWINRNELRHYKTIVAQSVMDPHSFNIGEIIEKKGEADKPYSFIGAADRIAPKPAWKPYPDPPRDEDFGSH